MAVAGFVVWLVFAALLLFGSQLRHAFQPLVTPRAARQALAERLVHRRDRARALARHDRPWVVAAASCSDCRRRLVDLLCRVWLFFLTLFSAISGAITSMAAARAASLWLRMGVDTRADLRASRGGYWRLQRLPARRTARALRRFGCVSAMSDALLALGLGVARSRAASSSLYLGLMMTRGLRAPIMPRNRDDGLHRSLPRSRSTARRDMASRSSSRRWPCSRSCIDIADTPLARPRLDAVP